MLKNIYKSTLSTIHNISMSLDGNDFNHVSGNESAAVIQSSDGTNFHHQRNHVVDGNAEWPMLEGRSADADVDDDLSSSSSSCHLGVCDVSAGVKASTTPNCLHQKMSVNCMKSAKLLTSKPPNLTLQQTRIFCKNAAFLCVMESRTLAEEYSPKTSRLLAVYSQFYTNGDLIDKRLFDFYILLRACDRFQAEKGRYPGTNGIPEHLDKLDLCQRVQNLAKLNYLPENYAPDPNLVEEMCRYGASEIHVVASFMGGLAAQEAIKIVTGVCDCMHTKVMRSDLLWEKHVQFLRRCIDVLPENYEQLDTSRLTLLYFVLSGLDILDALGGILEDEKRALIAWIYSLQIDRKPKSSKLGTGFRGSFTTCSSACDEECSLSYDVGHIAMTYSALACLTILGDDLAKIDVGGILISIKACQLSDGSFCGCTSGSENDMRFVYCAVASCSMLNDFSCLHVANLVKYIRRCFNYDGGFGQTPGNESHGGSTYCATASLQILGKLMDESVLSGSELSRLKNWCVVRQNEGFFGRPNKPDDSCYTFWIGATLKLLNGLKYIDPTKAVDFTLSTQDPLTGGFSKYPEVSPDLLHTYLSLAGLSILGFGRLRPIDPTLNITDRALRAKCEKNATLGQTREIDVSSDNVYTGKC